MAENGKVALVTGAGSGVGRAASLALLDAGYGVALAGRRMAALEETIGLAGAAGARAMAVAADVADEASVDALFAAVRARHGRLDLVFNNAGANAPGTSLEDVTLDDWKTVIDVNLTGMFLCIRAAFRIMKEQDPRGGRIINNGSISAHAPRPGSVAYTASKHGVTGLTKTAALDGRKHDIAVGQIDIGNAQTAMAARMADGVPQADGSVRPEPLMAVEDVGRAIVHMASLPLDANVLTMTVMATKMPFVGRG